MLKLKNGDILQVKPALEAILKLPADKLTVRGKYFMAKLGRKLSGPLADIEAARVKLVQQHGEKTEQGFSVKSPAALAAFQTGLAEVFDIEAEVDWEPVTLSDKDAEALTGGEMLMLDQFITFPDPVPSPNDKAKEVREVAK